MNRQPNTYIKHCQNEHAARTEVSGLEALCSAIDLCKITQLSIPIIVSSHDSTIELAQIFSTRASKAHWLNLATGLSKLHNQQQKSYGWIENNYIGLSPQYNEISENWGRFFIQFRLISQIEMIKDDKIKREFRSIVKSAFNSLELFLNQTTEYPSLLHGDLWNGNVLFSSDSDVYLIDPAVYFGDKEADIAMTELFGGFSSIFYDCYNEHSALTSAYPVKRTIYNLYHNLNHYNLFGDSYLYACKSGFSMIAEEFG